jgi:hypothetical protein
LFRLFSAKSSKKRTVLRKQRVKGDRLDKFVTRFSWSFAAKSLVVIFCGFLFWGLSIRAADKIHQAFGYLATLLVLTPNEWNIEVAGVSGDRLPDDLRNEIYRVAQKIVKTGSALELFTLSRQIESIGRLDAVKVIRPVANTIIIQASVRRPALLVEVGGKIRFLTIDGTVFGDAAQANSDNGAANPTVLVSGIFESRSSLAVDSSLRLPLVQEERQHLADAIDIWQKTTAAGVDVRAIKYMRFRGFTITLPDTTEIILGLNPFDYKISKLRSILDGLKRDGIVATRIELDYDGKAFIKEKRL